MKSRKAPCQHFAHCGGCSLQDLKYSDQLLQKQEALRRLFNKSILVHPAAEEFAYRSRMDFIFGHNCLGLRRKSSGNDIIDITECLLISERMRGAFNRIKSLLNQFSSYDLKTKKGFLRYLTLREGDDGLMVILTTTSPSEQEEKDLLSFLKSLSEKSVYWFVDDKLADDVGNGELKAQFGDKNISVTLNSISYSIAPFTFFQSNYSVAEKMFSVISKHATGVVLDLYCGIGAISRQLRQAEKVIAVESHAPSIQEAKLSGGAEFICEDSAEYLRQIIAVGEPVDTVIVDPPRTGLGLKACQSLKRLSPKTIIYMSCNPQTLRNDLALLNNYEQEFFEGYDMFPQTFHVECLVVLRK